MKGRLPLPTLLSAALVAFTIEFDNEFERQMPHRTSRHGSTHGSSDVAPSAPWLASMVVCLNCMRFVGKDGVTVQELQRLARTKTNLNGMQRWGYIVVDPEGNLIRATAKGRKAQQVWRPLFDSIEKRWQERFGEGEIEQLRNSLQALISQFDILLPDCLPILGYGLFTNIPAAEPTTPAHEEAPPRRLPILLAKALLAFALRFERDSKVSLAIGANVLRLVSDEGIRVRDLPRQSGVSKESIAMALTFLTKRGYAVVKPESSASRTKLLALTPTGRRAQQAYRERLRIIEEDWLARFGNNTIATLRESLEPIVGDATASHSPLFRGLEPYPDGWRASVPRPEGLPHYPMVLHRGGFPDGS
jgi:DNA-binding MarR family transcriptional regulator